LLWQCSESFGAKQLHQMIVCKEPLQCNAHEGQTLMHDCRAPNQGTLSLSVQLIL
jgi:hypothetical protein